MNNLSKQTRRALRAFDRAFKLCDVTDKKIWVSISTPGDDWTCRHSSTGDTLKQCRTDHVGIVHAHCPQLGLAAFVTFPATQDTATTSQIVQALRLECIRRSEEAV